MTISVLKLFLGIALTEDKSLVLTQVKLAEIRPTL